MLCKCPMPLWWCWKILILSWPRFYLLDTRALHLVGIRRIRNQSRSRHWISRPWFWPQAEASATEGETADIADLGRRSWSIASAKKAYLRSGIARIRPRSSQIRAALHCAGFETVSTEELNLSIWKGNQGLPCVRSTCLTRHQGSPIFRYNWRRQSWITQISVLLSTTDISACFISWNI